MLAWCSKKNQFLLYFLGSFENCLNWLHNTKHNQTMHERKGKHDVLVFKTYYAYVKQTKKSAIQ